MASSTTFLSTLVLFIAATLAFTTISAAVAEAAEIIEVENWYLPYNGPKEVTANVGDSIVFNWNTGHNVYIHPTMSCALDDIIFVGNKSPTTYTFTETDGGTDMFFGCDIGNGAHCRNGQNLIVTVLSDGGNPSSEDPEATLPPTAMDTFDDTDPDIIIGDDDDFMNATDGNATDVPGDNRSVETPTSLNAIIEDSSYTSASSHQNSVVTIAIGLVGAVAVILLV